MELSRMNGNHFDVPTSARSLASFSPHAAEVICSVVLFHKNVETVARLIHKDKVKLEFLRRIAIDGTLNHRRNDTNATFLLGEVQQGLESNQLQSFFSLSA